jgi:hypothetical protein
VRESSSGGSHVPKVVAEWDCGNRTVERGDQPRLDTSGATPDSVDHETNHLFARRHRVAVHLRGGLPVATTVVAE